MAFSFLSRPFAGRLRPYYHNFVSCVTTRMSPPEHYLALDQQLELILAETCARPLAAGRRDLGRGGADGGGLQGSSSQASRRSVSPSSSYSSNSSFSNQTSSPSSTPRSAGQHLHQQQQPRPSPAEFASGGKMTTSHAMRSIVRAFGGDVSQVPPSPQGAVCGSPYVDDSDYGATEMWARHAGRARNAEAAAAHGRGGSSDGKKVSLAPALPRSRFRRRRGESKSHGERHDDSSSLPRGARECERGDSDSDSSYTGTADVDTDTDHGGEQAAITVRREHTRGSNDVARQQGGKSKARGRKGKSKGGGGPRRGAGALRAGSYHSDAVKGDVAGRAAAAAPAPAAPAAALAAAAAVLVAHEDEYEESLYEGRSGAAELTGEMISGSSSEFLLRGVDFLVMAMHGAFAPPSPATGTGLGTPGLLAAAAMPMLLVARAGHLVPCPPLMRRARSRSRYET